MRALRFWLGLVCSLALLLLLTRALLAVSPSVPDAQLVDEICHLSLPEELNPSAHFPSSMTNDKYLPLAYAPGDPPAPEPAPARPAPPVGPTAVPCLPAPKHFSELPQLLDGVDLALSRYLRFVTPDGRPVYARMFLMEMHPERARFPDNPPPEVAEKRRRVPARMLAIGHEIKVDDPAAFVPDFDVNVQYVKPAGACAYEVDLGAVKVRVRTVE